MQISTIIQSQMTSWETFATELIWWANKVLSMVTTKGELNLLREDILHIHGVRRYVNPVTIKLNLNWISMLKPPWVY